jgi:uncharacterized protein YndB with AHSA1/START domain
MAARTGAARKLEEGDLVVTRDIEAPRIRVFEAWTRPEHVRQWWGPNGFTMPFCRIELRPGGAFHNCMRSPEGRDYWSKGIYREIIEPERIVFTDFFSDEEGTVVQPSQYGMDPEWPLQTTVTVTLARLKNGTRVTVHHAVPESLAERTGARQGWAESLDRLAGYLAKG